MYYFLYCLISLRLSGLEFAAILCLLGAGIIPVTLSAQPHVLSLHLYRTIDEALMFMLVWSIA